MEKRLLNLEKRIISGDRSALLEYVRLQRKLFYRDHRRLVEELK